MITLAYILKGAVKMNGNQGALMSTWFSVRGSWGSFAEGSGITGFCAVSTDKSLLTFRKRTQSVYFRNQD
jgi:hypothetical protein